MHAINKSNQGFALVVVIWILTLLSLMAGSFALSMRRDSSVSVALKKNAEAMAAAESGMELAVFMMQNPDPEQRWLTDGSVYQILRADGSQIRIKVSSEAGKIDINAANEKLLSAVIKSVTNDLWAEQKLLNSILDWRDADDEPRPQGAEKKQYDEAGLPYKPTNSPLQSLEELQMIIGITPEIYNAIQPLLTVYSGQSDVNINEATPEVLQILRSVESGQTQQIPTGSQQTPTTSNSTSTTNTNNTAASTPNSIYAIGVDVVMEDNASASLQAIIKLQTQDATQAAQQVLAWKQNQLLPSLFANGTESQLITIQNEFTINN
ncbi:type II secretion system protein GspK [Methylomonas sp. AM2-LC]|uniref:general secretion pathway protein GspK n=1 Tax=Methylomonas sp. AM2-LC TaxID=3153301 RepID=UPI003262F107